MRPMENKTMEEKIIEAMFQYADETPHKLSNLVTLHFYDVAKYLANRFGGRVYLLWKLPVVMISKKIYAPVSDLEDLRDLKNRYASDLSADLSVLTKENFAPIQAMLVEYERNKTLSDLEKAYEWN